MISHAKIKGCKKGIIHLLYWEEHVTGYSTSMNQIPADQKRLLLSGAVKQQRRSTTEEDAKDSVKKLITSAVHCPKITRMI